MCRKLSQKKTEAGLNQKKAAKRGDQSSAQPAGRMASEVTTLQAQHSTNEELRVSETKGKLHKLNALRKFINVLK